MKKISLSILALLVGLSVAVPVYAADEDYSDTDAWYQKCTQAQTSEDGVKACEGFQAYQNQKKEDLKNSIGEFNSSISSLSAESSAIEEAARQQKELADQLSSQITEKEQAIQLTEQNIQNTQAEIEQKQAEIEAWDAQIKERMKKEQTNTGTNALVDLIMGSKSLPDLLRRVTGISRITQSDQAQIEELNRMKEQLEFTKQELERLNAQQETEKADLEEQKSEAEALEASYQQLVEQYEHQIAELEAQKRNMETDLNSIKDFSITMAQASTIDYGAISAGSSSGWINPVPNGYTSAGTWAYNGGGLHLGLDRAAPVGSPLLAPVDGLVIFASNSAPSTGGYLGNWIGHPAGSGNTIEMLAEVNGTLYAISFFHLSNEFYVSAGQTVSQGQTLALTGHSGNSTGPHTHIEVYNLGSMSMADAVARFASTGDTAFGTGWGSTATACENTGTAPCRERPEKFF